MRQIYTSARTENVDRVVAMMAQAGIATSVTNRKSYGGSDYKRPSYSTQASRDSWPQVWIVNADDQPRARALLREAGVEPAVRFADELAQSRNTAGKPSANQLLVKRLRTFLLLAIAFIILLNFIGVLKFF